MRSNGTRTTCNYGKNGEDPLATDGDQADLQEQVAGVEISREDLVP